MDSIHEVDGGSRGHVAEIFATDLNKSRTLVLGIYGRRGTAKHGVIFVDASQLSAPLPNSAPSASTTTSVKAK